MDTLAEINQLKSEVSGWYEWVVSEEDTLNRATDDYLKQLLRVRLVSGWKILLIVEQELIAKVNAYNTAMVDKEDIKEAV